MCGGRDRIEGADAGRARRRTDDPDAELATHAFLLEALAGQVRRRAEACARAVGLRPSFLILHQGRSVAIKSLCRKRGPRLRISQNRALGSVTAALLYATMLTTTPAATTLVATGMLHCSPALCSLVFVSARLTPCWVQCEGLMAKALDGAGYEPGRRADSWVKLKRDYIDGMADSLDLVPIGAWCVHCTCAH